MIDRLISFLLLQNSWIIVIFDIDAVSSFWSQVHPTENDPNDPSQSNRFNVVIEKIERLYMVMHMLLSQDAFLTLYTMCITSLPQVLILLFDRAGIVVTKKIWVMCLMIISMPVKILSLMMLNWLVISLLQSTFLPGC